MVLLDVWCRKFFYCIGKIISNQQKKLQEHKLFQELILMKTEIFPTVLLTTAYLNCWQLSMMIFIMFKTDISFATTHLYSEDAMYWKRVVFNPYWVLVFFFKLVTGTTLAPWTIVSASNSRISLA